MFCSSDQNLLVSQELVDERTLLLRGNVPALDVTNLIEDSFRVTCHGHLDTPEVILFLYSSKLLHCHCPFKIPCSLSVSFLSFYIYYMGY